MFYALLSLLLFSCSVIIHLFYCRNKPKAGLYVKAYGMIAFVFFYIYALVAEHWPLAQEGSLWSMPFKFTAGVLYLLLVPFYLTFYRHTQWGSPSHKILLALSRRGAMSLPEIVASVREEDFIATRLADLRASECVSYDNGRYVLRPYGKVIVKALEIMRYVLGRDMGG